MQQALQVPSIFRVHQAVLKDAHVFMLPQARQHSLGVAPTLQQRIPLFDQQTSEVRCVTSSSIIITPFKRLLLST